MEIVESDALESEASAGAASPKPAASIEEAVVPEIEGADNEKTNVVESDRVSQSGMSLSDAESDDLEDYEDDEDEDDAPTRVMKRPNYQSIRLSHEELPGVDSTIQDVLETADAAVDAKTQMVKRIREAEVIESSMTLSHNVVYDPNDLLAFPFDAELEAKENAAMEAIEAENAQNQRAHQKSREPAHSGKKKSHGFTRTQRFILCALTLIVFIMILSAIIIALKRMG
jgi:hypothetical protein